MERAFVVQFSAACSSGDTFLGKVEHVRSGQATHFTTVEELLVFIFQNLEVERQMKETESL
jgi:hypothetical protein